MNNYCRNCGAKLEKNIKVCPNCNVEVISNRINVEDKKKEIEKFSKTEKILTIAAIVLILIAFVSFVSNNKILSYVWPIAILMALITIIYGTEKLKNSKIMKYFLIFMILLIIIIVYYNIYVLISCGNMFVY